MDAGERIDRARQAIGAATELLKRPHFDHMSAIAVQLETALSELERVARAGIGPQSAAAVVRLCGDLRLVTALHSNAARFYRGWADLAAAAPTSYDRTGAETQAPVSTTVSAKG